MLLWRELRPPAVGIGQNVEGDTALNSSTVQAQRGVWRMLDGAALTCE